MPLSMTTTIETQGAERISRNLSIVIFKVVIASSATTSGGDAIATTAASGAIAASRKISDFFDTDKDGNTNILTATAQWENADNITQTTGFFPQYNIDEDTLEFINEVDGAESALSAADTIAGTIFITAIGRTTFTG